MNQKKPQQQELQEELRKKKQKEELEKNEKEKQSVCEKCGLPGHSAAWCILPPNRPRK